MISAQATKLFFDRKAVLDAVGKAAAANLSKAGAYVRTAARSSLRRRKRISAAGSPPSVHSRDSFRSLKTIWFAWDSQSRSVVIGPVGFNSVSAFGGSLRAGVVPSLLEGGGNQGIVERQMRDGSWMRADLRSRRRLAGQTIRVRTATYAARPFMGPAMNQELPKFPELWKNSVVRTT